MLSNSWRLDDTDREMIDFYFDRKKLSGYDGEPIAASLLANGIKTIRACEVTGENRGLFCGIGHCYECRAEVNGVPNVRTCLTPNRQGTRVISIEPSLRKGEGKR
jgi:sarcosine oxidase subunit alpha